MILALFRHQQTKQKAMKRFYLAILFFVLFLAGYSQKHIRLSFTGSPSLNWMNTNNSEASSGKVIPGYDFGLNGDLYFSADERYSLLTGLLISNVGGEMAFDGNTGFQFAGKEMPANSQIKYLLRYIEVPLSIKLKTDHFRRMAYWGQLGLSGMINIGSKGKSSNEVLKKTSINDEINLFNLAMNIGLGFDFDLGSSNSASVGLIFQNGLTDVTTDNAFSDKTIINSLKIKLGLIF
jgi:hypothetical protein